MIGARRIGSGRSASRTGGAPRFILTAASLTLLTLAGCAPGEEAAVTGTVPARSLINMRQADVVATLGEPAFRREETPPTAQTWRYRSPRCVLELMLYRTDQDYRVMYLEARDDQFRQLPADACVDSVVAQRRLAAS